MDDEEFELLKEIVKRGNKRHASFWEGSNKEQKELGVVQDFCKSMDWEVKCESNTQDPPDCTCRDEKEELIGFEVTELVDQKILEKNVGKSKKVNISEVYRDWRGGEVVEALEEILARKDSKIFKGGPYKKLILIIHNDELGLDEDEVRNTLKNYQFNATNQIDEAYLLLSYRSNVYPSYPVISLEFRGQ
ncbi:MAG: hypothetical protein MJD61_12185 [Proteobacteria bacterium]|nr:hypothetical protein [Pseudomonadota bacterium]